MLTNVQVDDPLTGGPVTLDVTTLAPGEVTTGTATHTVTQDRDTCLRRISRLILKVAPAWSMGTAVTDEP